MTVFSNLKNLSCLFAVSMGLSVVAQDPFPYLKLLSENSELKKLCFKLHALTETEGKNIGLACTCLDQHLEYVRHKQTEKPTAHQAFLSGFADDLGDRSASFGIEALVRETATRKAIGLLVARQPNPVQAGIDEYRKFNTVLHKLIDERYAEKKQRNNLKFTAFEHFA